MACTPFYGAVDYIYTCCLNDCSGLDVCVPIVCYTLVLLDIDYIYSTNRNIAGLTGYYTILTY